MFHDSSYMGGMHFWWWTFWFLALVATLLFAWQRPARNPYKVLRQRLASGAITPLQYEEHKAMLDRDG